LCNVAPGTGIGVIVVVASVIDLRSRTGRELAAVGAVERLIRFAFAASPPGSSGGGIGVVCEVEGSRRGRDEAADKGGGASVSVEMVVPERAVACGVSTGSPLAPSPALRLEPTVRVIRGEAVSKVPSRFRFRLSWLRSFLRRGRSVAGGTGTGVGGPALFFVGDFLALSLPPETAVSGIGEVGALMLNNACKSEN
jgi:hypothetical protein